MTKTRIFTICKYSNNKWYLERGSKRLGSYTRRRDAVRGFFRKVYDGTIKAPAVLKHNKDTFATI